MRIPTDCQILKATSDDATRLALAGVYFDAEAKTLTATDGRILTCLKVDTDDGDKSGIVPPEAIKEAVKLSKARGPWRVWPATILGTEDGKAVKLLDGRTFPMIQMTFPNWVQVLPKLDHARQRVARLQLDPELLLALAQAAGRTDETNNRGVLLEFELDGEDDAAPKPIKVTVGHGGAALHAVIMPIKLNSRAPNRIDDADAAQVEYGNSPKQKA